MRRIGMIERDILKDMQAIRNYQKPEGQSQEACSLELINRIGKLIDLSDIYEGMREYMGRQGDANRAVYSDLSESARLIKSEFDGWRATREQEEPLNWEELTAANLLKIDILGSKN